MIIGSGCIGSAIARELSRYSLKTLLLESADDVSQGATKGNSGIVHAGYDDKPGSLHAKFCWPGNQMFPQLDRELRFGYQLNGSLVLATNKDELKILDELMERGRQNGVQRLRIVQKEELFEMEPALNPNGMYFCFYFTYLWYLIRSTSCLIDPMSLHHRVNLSSYCGTTCPRCWECDTLRVCHRTC